MRIAFPPRGYAASLETWDSAEVSHLPSLRAGQAPPPPPSRLALALYKSVQTPAAQLAWPPPSLERASRSKQLRRLPPFPAPGPCPQIFYSEIKSPTPQLSSPSVARDSFACPRRRTRGDVRGTATRLPRRRRRRRGRR